MVRGKSELCVYLGVGVCVCVCMCVRTKNKKKIKRTPQISEMNF